MDKNTVRTLVKEKISKLSLREKKTESLEVSKKLIKLLSEKDFKTLVTYTAFEDEVDISEVELWWKEHGKDIYTIPQNNDPVEIPAESIIIVPWRVFTENGIRVGRWSGYYDRLLTQHKNTFSIGVCFACQIFPNLPEESWDQRLDEVVFSGNILE